MTRAQWSVVMGILQAALLEVALVTGGTVSVSSRKRSDSRQFALLRTLTVA